MKISKDCLDEALRALKDFTHDELKDYVYEVFDKAKGYTNMSNMKAFNAAMKDINDSRLKSYFESTMTAANNVLKINHNIDRIKSRKANIKTIWIKRHSNLGDNVASAQGAARQELDAVVFDKITREQTEFFSSGDNDDIIGKAMDGKETGSKDAKLNANAKVVSDLLKEVYFPERNALLITSNAMPFDHINEDRAFRNIHDPVKLMMGGRSAIDEARSKEKFTTDAAKKKWITKIKKHYNLINVRSGTDIDKVLDEMYDNITTGKSDIFTRSAVINDRVAIQNKARRRLQPKSMEDFIAYNKEYGQGNLFQALLMDMHSSANKIGMARIVGDSPHTAFLEFKKAQQKYAPFSMAKDPINYHTADLYFNEVMGVNKHAVSPTLAAFDANTRSMSAMAKLPLVALNSIPDKNYMAVFAQNHGFSYFEALGIHLKSILGLYPKKDHAYLAKIYSGLFRDNIGYAGKVMDSQNSSEFMNKISTRYFKANGLHTLDKSSKMSGLRIVSMCYARNMSKTFDKLPLAAKNWLNKFLEPEEWELLRGKTKDGLFTVDNVNALTDKEIKDFYDAGNKSRPLHEIRNDLYRKVHAMAQIATENMVLNPAEFEKAFVLRGTRPGTPEGVLLRQIMQFKFFNISALDKVYLQGYRNADANQQKLAWATALFMGNIPLSYGIMVLDNLAQGKSMPDPTKMNTTERIEFAVKLLCAPLSIIMSLFDLRHRTREAIVSLLNSPVLSFLSEAIETVISLFDGNPKETMKLFKDTMGYVLPINTFPILSPLLSEAMGDKGYLQPGQQHIFGR